MSKIRLHGSSSGYTEIAPVAASGNNTLTLPNDGTIISKDSNGAVGVTSVVTTTATITTAKVGAAVTISESGIEASGIGITCANINGAQIGGRRNMIINGDMNIAQRGTPTAAASYTTAGYGACDRWKLRAINTDEADFVISQESDAPTGSGFSRSLKIKTNTVENTLDSNEIFHVSQPIEAQDLQHLKNGTSSALPVTLSFWVKSYQTGTYAVNVYKPDTSNRQITATYTISDSNTWEFKTMTFPGDTSGGGITNDNGTGFQIYWLLATGTDYTGTTSTSWDNYANGGFANGQAVNIMSSTDNYFYLTGVQFEVGSQATAFEHRSYVEELRLCQRYFVKNTLVSGCGKAYNSASDGFRWWVSFPTQMRNTPTMTTSGGTDGGSVASFGIIYSSIDGYTPVISSDDSSTDVWYYGATVNADAEL